MEPWDELKAKTGELLDEGLRSGALTPEEHRWRRGHLAQASGPEALDALVEDLLDTDSEEEVATAQASQLTVLSQRTLGLGDLGRRSEVVNLLGSTRVALRGVADQSVFLEMVTILGETVVEVPDGVKVRLNGTPILGECSLAPELRGADPTVNINGVVVMGSLRIVRAPRKTITS